MRQIVVPATSLAGVDRERIKQVASIFCQAGAIPQSMEDGVITARSSAGDAYPPPPPDLDEPADDFTCALRLDGLLVLEFEGQRMSLPPEVASKLAAFLRVGPFGE